MTVLLKEASYLRVGVQLANGGVHLKKVPHERVVPLKVDKESDCNNEDLPDFAPSLLKAVPACNKIAVSMFPHS